jgi:isoquinoline 1-oxidoreductase subunit beta
MIQNPTPEEELPPVKTNTKRRRWRVSRRGFLIGAAVGGMGLALGINYGVTVMHLRMAEAFDSGDGPPSKPTNDPWAWFEISPDSQLRLFLAKIEMGQGVHTALAQIAAEELEVTVAELEVVQASTAVGPQDPAITSGSNTVSSLYTPLREAAATLREMLRAEAAAMLAQPSEELVVNGRAFHHPGSDRTLTFGEIVTHQRTWEVPSEPPRLKNHEDFTIIGQPVYRVDIPAKVTGSAMYGYDVKLPGMKFGAVLRQPSLEAKLRSANLTEAAQAPGVTATLHKDEFVGVVADSRAAAQRAVAQIRAIWDEGKPWQQAEIEELVTVGGNGGVVIQKEGDAPKILRNAGPGLIEAEYRTPLAVQTPLEAQAALAEVQPDRARIWVSTQMQSRVRDLVASALKMDAKAVEVIPTYLGGGFGRKSGFDVAVEAALLAQAAGVPVHVGWTRTEELRHGYFRPPTHHRLAATLDHRGHITALQHEQASGDVAFGFLPGYLALIMGSDFGATRGARVHYAIPNLQTVAFRRPLPVPTGWWRGLGLLPNIFAIESFMDELAYAAGSDPLAFRLRHLPETFNGQRMRAVLEAAADKAGWGTPPPPGRARGVACCMDADTMVAQVAEVSLDIDQNKVRVHKFVAAMDCGLVVNPDGAKAQVEGNIMWGVGSALLEEVKIRDGRVELTNFNEYPLLTMRDAPHVETLLLEAGDGRPRGVGEPPIGPVAAAIANGFYALTGQRMRTLPITPERIAAL